MLQALAVRWVGGACGPLPWLRRGFQALGLAALLVLVLGLPVVAADPVAAATAAEAYLCDGDPLVARLEPGAVDAPGIPNTSAGTVPGAVMVLQWRGQRLALPRTNNAGAPSFSDGIWWWSQQDADRPDFRLRRGGIQRFACRRSDSSAGSVPAAVGGEGEPARATGAGP